MLDPQDEQFDRRLGNHLVSLYNQNQSQQEPEESSMDMADLRDYIAFARCNIKPQLSQEASETLVQAYASEYAPLTLALIHSPSHSPWLISNVWVNLQAINTVTASFLLMSLKSLKCFVWDCVHAVNRFCACSNGPVQPRVSHD